MTYGDWMAISCAIGLGSFAAGVMIGMLIERNLGLPRR